MAVSAGGPEWRKRHEEMLEATDEGSDLPKLLSTDFVSGVRQVAL